MSARLGRYLPLILVGFGLAGLWFVSSAGVAEGLLYGRGRLWPFFVAIKAVSASIILFSLMVFLGLGLRHLIDRGRASLGDHIFPDGDVR